MGLAAHTPLRDLWLCTFQIVNHNANTFHICLLVGKHVKNDEHGASTGYLQGKTVQGCHES